MKLDPRYKVTAEIVLEILNLRARGCSFKNIANKFNISVSTAWYWSSADYRQKQREKNKKRMALTVSDLEKAKKYAKILETLVIFTEVSFSFFFNPFYPFITN